MDLFFNIVLNGIKWKIVYRIVDFPVSQTGQWSQRCSSCSPYKENKECKIPGTDWSLGHYNINCVSEVIQNSYLENMNYL